MKYNWTKNNFHSLTSIAYSYKLGHPPADKYMPKVTSDCTINVKLYINFAPRSSWNYCSMSVCTWSAFISNISNFS